MIFQNPITPIVEIFDSLLTLKQLRLYVKREDLTDEVISGNKWYKLKYNLIEAEKKGYDTILTFGGAFSNHIHATAYAGKKYGFKTIGIIRGEMTIPLNPTLKSASENGMLLEYIDRNSYRKKEDVKFINDLQTKFGNFFLIPEGGSNALAVKGCSEIVKGIDSHYDYICTACGTGGTIAGLIYGLNSRSFVLGFSVLKGGEFLVQNVNNLLMQCKKNHLSNWMIVQDYHFGGYAKINNELVKFCKEFKIKHNIEIEPIYTGKMIWGLFDLIKQDFFPPKSKILVIHTGGLQGLLGLRMRGMY